MLLEGNGGLEVWQMALLGLMTSLDFVLLLSQMMCSLVDNPLLILREFGYTYVSELVCLELVTCCTLNTDYLLVLAVGGLLVLFLVVFCVCQPVL